MATLGVLLSLVALFSWGFADFNLQKIGRTIGVAKAMFYIGLIGFVVLLPFIYKEIPLLLSDMWGLSILLGATAIVIGASFADFKALSEGKIAVVEPIIGLELPITIGLGLFLKNESLNTVQAFSIAAVIIGIIMVITSHHTQLHLHKRLFERGVVFALLGAIGTALTNFIVGVSSEATSPLLTVWFAYSLTALICVPYLIFGKQKISLWLGFRKEPGTIAAGAIFYNLGWITFAYATTMIPIGIATTISGGYIAFAALLGIVVSKERLKHHQILGVVMAAGGIVFLSAMT